jgi:YHS domain-containing protein
MMFAELFVPKGTYSQEKLQQLGQRLVAALLAQRDGTPEQETKESADPGVVEFLSSITHVVVHEPETWITAGRALGPDIPPRYVVRVQVPGPWRKDLSEHLITSITRVLADLDDAGERLYQAPHAEVHVLGVPEGGYGAFGGPVGEARLLDMINKSKRSDSPSMPDGMIKDPICGAVISLGTAVLLEHDGRTYGFCCTGCRRHFERQNSPAEAS